MPPHAWLTQLRANRARGLLLAGEAPTSVAYRCGFSDQSHLTRTFRSMFGMTPAAYVRG
jgi:AraC-like DNA-binding protein